MTIIRATRAVPDEHGEPWFIAMDVAGILDYKDTEAMTRRLDDDEVRNLQIVGFNNRGVNVINESGLFASILGSQKPQAKAFRKFVTGDVLPAIRKTGSYHSPNAQAEPTPYPATPRLAQLEVDLFFADRIAASLRLSDTSKLQALQAVAARNGVSPGILPAYSDDKLAHSLTKLLQDAGSPMSAVKANKALVGMGYLEVLERPGHEQQKDGKRKAVTRQFKSITEAGLKYGKNCTAPENPRETEPRWYVATFPQLLKEMEEYLAGV